MSRYRLSVPARADLREIRAHITREGSAGAAARWIETLRSKFRALAGTPGMGRARDELAPGLRSFPVGAYVIFYRQGAGGVEIVRVLHGARDIERIFEAQPEE